MHTRLFVQVVFQLRRADQHRLGVLVLAVEDAQRVALQAALAVFVQLLQARREELDQRITVACTGFAGAQAVEFQLDRVLDAQQAPQAPGQHDQLGVDVRTVEVEHFHADLVELAVAALLRALVAEHRADVPQLLWLAAADQAVLLHRAHAGGGAFRAQGQRVAVAVVEGVHLLLDDVGDLADRALEQLGELDDRHADLPVAVAVQ
ncbi:hypothetical protein D3C75_836320 [compost metagenome]